MATATPSLVSVDEYLRCNDYEPDAEYVDGVIEERPMGEVDHSGLQTRIASILDSKAYRSYFRCYAEFRVQTSARRFRIPDVCLVRAASAKEKIAQTPPLLCIEVLSPEDRMSRTMIRVKDFLTMGVPEVWIVDPETRTIQVCTGSNITIHSEGHLKVPENPVTVLLTEIFQALDD